MRAIVGRLSDLGVRELFKLLTSARAEGALEFESAAGRAGLSVRHGHVAGETSAPLVAALLSRTGTFCFRPGIEDEDRDWLPVEEFLARLEADARLASADSPATGGTTQGSLTGSEDVLAELRASLAEVLSPSSSPRVAVVTADPRPYRALEVEWRQRGWQLEVTTEVAFPLDPLPGVVVLHLPAGGTMGGQAELWLRLLRKAGATRPRIPVLWIGGLADPSLRHQAILAGADFLLPAPVGDAGEAARWFREEVSLLVERLLAAPTAGREPEAEAFREFFLALHTDSEPAEVRASLLRFASGYFARGALLAVRDNGFESLGGYGFATVLPARVPRGGTLLEEVVVGRRPGRVPAGSESGALAASLGLRDQLRGAELLPVLLGKECVAVFLGDSPLGETGSGGLASLLATSGGLLAL